MATPKPSATNCPQFSFARLCFFGYCRCLSVVFFPMLLSYSVIKAVIAPGFHLFPFRTEQLSPCAPMVLRSSGRVGRRRFLSADESCTRHVGCGTLFFVAVPAPCPCARGDGALPLQALRACPGAFQPLLAGFERLARWGLKACLAGIEAGLRFLGGRRWAEGMLPLAWILGGRQVIAWLYFVCWY